MVNEMNILSSHNIPPPPHPEDNGGHQDPKLFSCIYMIHFICSVTSRICTDSYFPHFLCNTAQILTLNLLTWKIWWAHNNASRGQMGFNSAFKGLKRVHICYASMLWPVIKSVMHIHQIHVYFSELYKQKCATFCSSFCASTTVYLTWKTCLWFLIPVATSSEEEIQKVHSHEYSGRATSLLSWFVIRTRKRNE